MFYPTGNNFTTARADMTPVIDIVFLLIIFFMLVCQFIAAENFHIQVPDSITAAQDKDALNTHSTVISLIMTENGTVSYAVGAERIDPETPDLQKEITQKIDSLFEPSSNHDKLITLRADKSVTFGQVKKALAAVSKSCASSVRLAVIKDENIR